MKKFLSAIMAVLLVFTLVFAAACGDDNGGGDNTGGDGTATYNVIVKTQGGQPVGDVTVNMSSPNASHSRETGEDGIAKFENITAAEYTVTVDKLPVGCTPQKNSYLTHKYSEDVSVILNTELILDTAPQGTSYEEGDVMYDFTFTEVESGEQYSLSELFETKEMVMLNFFFSACGPCQNEFPAMIEAYEKYKNDVAIISIDPIDGEEGTLAAKKSFHLPFYVVSDQSRDIVTNFFNVSSYPTNVIIDRFGVITMIDKGGIFDSDIFSEWFANHTGDDYVQDIGNEFELILPTVENPDVKDIAAALNNNVSFEYAWDYTSEYNWPFVIDTVDGERVVKSSNAGARSSWAYMNCNFNAAVDSVVAFDVMTSTEAGCDIFYVFLDGEIIYEYSGRDKGWQTCYAYVGDGFDHEFTFAYVKDMSGNAGDDTVYLKNMRVTNVQELVDKNVTINVLRQAATNLNAEEERYETFITPVYNEEDGFYHVNSKDGPFLLADITSDTQWGYSIFNQAYDAARDPDVLLGDPEYKLVEYYNLIQEYTFYENFLSSTQSVDKTVVSQELKNALVDIVSALGNDDQSDNETEWLEICRYYQQYGAEGQPKISENPISGSTLKYTVEFNGTADTENYHVEAVPKTPRGMFFVFRPEQDGVYAITTDNIEVSSACGTVLWQFAYTSEDIADPDFNVLDQNPAIYRETESDSYGNLLCITDRLIAGEYYYFSVALDNPSMVGSFDLSIAKYDGTSVVRPVSEQIYVGTGSDDAHLPTYVEVSYSAADGVYYAYDDGNNVGPVWIAMNTQSGLWGGTLSHWINGIKASESDETLYKMFDLSDDGYFATTVGKDTFERIVPEDMRIDLTAEMQEYEESAVDGYVQADARIVEILSVVGLLQGNFDKDSWMAWAYYFEQVA